MDNMSVNFLKNLQGLRPSMQKNRIIFHSRHVRERKYLSGCQCAILPPCGKIMYAADCKSFGRKAADFSPVIRG